MDGQVLNIIANYGLETVCIALAVNLCTAVIKLPVKALAHKLKDGSRITRFIVFLPVLLGLTFTVIYSKYIAHTPVFDKSFTTLWLTSSSLSLTFYAIFEKQKKKKNQTALPAETEESRELIEDIRAAMDKLNGKAEENPNGNAEQSSEEFGKIILRGKNDEKNDAEEK